MGALTRERGHRRVKLGSRFLRPEEVLTAASPPSHPPPPIEEALVGLGSLADVGWAEVGQQNDGLASISPESLGRQWPREWTLLMEQASLGCKNPRAEESLLAPVGLPSV